MTREPSFINTLSNSRYLTGMNFLNSLDMSNNSFNSSAVPPWHTSLEALTTLLVFDDVWKHICKSRSSVELFIYFLN
ncbi:unnamed protein product [Camellia sinensis]